MQLPTNPTPGTGSAPSIAGQSYNGTEGVERLQLHFLPNGVLHYRDPFGWWENGRWWQNGTQLTMEVGDGGFVKYTATISGDLIAGDAVNKKGTTWKFAVQRGKPVLPPSVSLAGTSWGGMESDQCIVFHFANGTASYDLPDGGHGDDGIYRIDGKFVDIELEGGDLRYYGALRDDNKLSGNLWTKDRRTFQWSLDKGVVPPGCNPAVKTKPNTPQVASIEGATFAGDNGGDPMTIVFKAGGALEATDAEGTYPGTWNQSGDQLTFELNGRFAWYEGKLTGGTISGDGHNKNGLNWKFSFTRK